MRRGGWVRWWLPDVEVLLRWRAAATRPEVAANERYAWRVTWVLSLAVVAALYATAAWQVVGGLDGSPLVCSGVFLLALRPLLDRAPRFARCGADAAVAASLALCGFALLDALGASFAVEVAGFRRMPLLPNTTPPWFCVGCGAAMVSVWVIPPFAASGASWRSHGVALRRVARLAWCAVAALAVAACLSPRAEFDRRRYFDALPRGVTVRDVASLPSVSRHGEVYLFKRVSPLATTTGEYLRASARPELPEPQSVLIEEVRVEPREAVELRHDRARSLVLMRANRTMGLWAFDARTGVRVDRAASDFGAHAGPPRAWTAGALLGLLVSVVLLSRRWRASAAGWATGVLRDGRVECADGRSWRVMPRLDGEGPVVLRERAVPAVYRGDAVVEADAVIAGRADDLAHAVAAADAGRDAYALATLVLTATPLCVGAARGLLFG